jgi:membrane-anchored glycerophosphoryl diester phosphodiesterase (GDPDase)
MDVSGMFSGAVSIMKRRIGLFLLIASIPLLASIVVVAGIVIAILVGGGLIAVQGSRPVGALLIGGVVVGVLLIIALALIQLKSYAMTITASYRIAQGQQPSMRSVLAETKGFLPRLASLFALAIGIVILLSTGIGLLFFAMFSTIVSNSHNQDAVFALVFAVVASLLIFLIVLPLVVYINTKLLYVLPAVALEEIGGIAAVKRSWRLTAGAFWRTFAYYLLPTLAIGMVSYLLGLVPQLMATPLSDGLEHSRSASEVLAGTMALLPVLAITTILQMAIQLFSSPFLNAYLTCMFIDQVRRVELPPMPSHGRAPAPDYGYPPSAFPPGPVNPNPGPQATAPWQQPQPPQQGTPPSPWPPTGQTPPPTT